MANKIITYTQITNTKKDRLDMYRDINMMSDQSYTNNTVNYKIAKLSDIEAIKNSLHNIFSWQQGERILLPEFGTKLKSVLYNGITNYNIELIIAEIRDSVNKWEPRIVINDIINIRSVDTDDDNVVQLEIVYSIPSLTDEKFNYTLIHNTSV